MAACEGIRIRGFTGKLHLPATCSERVSFLVSTRFNHAFVSHRCHPNAMILPDDSNTLGYRTETLHGNEDSKIKRPRLDSGETGTDDEVADWGHWGHRPAESAHREDASPMSVRRQLSPLEHQGCDFFESRVFKGATAFPSSRSPDHLLYVPSESLLNQLCFDTVTEIESGGSCFDVSDCEAVPELGYDQTPNPVYEDGPLLARQHLVPRSELPYTCLDIVLKSSPDEILPFHQEAMCESPNRPDPVNVKIVQQVPTTKLTHRRVARSRPECCRGRYHRNPKAKAQYLRDRNFRTASMPIEAPTALRVDNIPLLNSESFKLKRKHCAFVQEQELRCLFEDRVGTPHLSELQPGDDVNAQLNVDELSVGGEVAALSIVDGATQGLSEFAITDIPYKGLGPN
ncbi:uncharacterized protein CC84DRAFT_389074 [Paraphaeosphaeria sporulosa]|uniref:Uncharacterized protein n=1 Tax=Paraphaeosphaeria sporulosa TaxID=1460663 RepID=A0A177BV31_9PLEO|nr:uncharacterized protein CC84DRAFT_389074 [Paraphaeosphaeria sporulosa]OAF99252.1 hypothetical protein CC84DRAFT_389074 [Paraphaeosphaeria sporulosa]